MSWKNITLAASLTIGLSSAAHADGRFTRPSVPGDIEVSDDRRLVLVAHAFGTQNYICAPAPTATGVDWLFIGPQATLFDAATGHQVATHFHSKNPQKADAVQATWQHSRDSSVIWATRTNGSTDAAYVAPGAIEWLLLDVTGADLGPSGGQKVSSVLQIQRVHTVGGMKPPSAECTVSILNTRRLVTYEADYYFYE